MPGGLLQLVAYGQANIILNGNPSKTFFKAVYKPYTPFGLQRFRLDYDGQRHLSFDAPVTMDFKIPRYAELIWDTYIVVNLPDIWSPVHYRSDLDPSNNYLPYEFQWTKNLGFTMIRQVTVYSGGSTLAQYSGEYMMNMMRRDEGGKRVLLGRMVGNERRLFDPKSFNGGNYPNAIYSPNYDTTGIEPSIRGRQLYIPLMAWFCYSSKTALPLIALQYQEVHIKIEFRPIRELFTILNVTQIYNPTACPSIPPPTIGTCRPCPDDASVNPATVNPANALALNLERKAPDSASVTDQMWRFLQPPTALPKSDTDNNNIYLNRRNDWNADVHLMSTYIFLGEEERRTIAAQCHNILIKTQFEWDFMNVTGSRRVNIPSRDMVSSYMWRFRRSDANLRNQWNNYQNYPWENVIPSPPVFSREISINNLNIYSTGARTIENRQDILIDMAILCGQDYRENILSAGVYNYVEKWFRTTGIAKNGLYCYNFCINSNRRAYQPSGAQNCNKWKWITFEFNTIQPPRNQCTDTNSVDVLCDPSGAIIGVRKDVWSLNQYNYDLRVFEERYNMIEIVGGRIGLLLAR